MEARIPPAFLNFHHLRYFWTVAKEGSLRRAAEKLHVSQPSISSPIQQLASSLGEDLFRRRGRASVLTEFGHLVYSYADEIFTLGGELLRATRQAPTSRSLRLHAGIVDSFPKLMSFHILRPIFEHDPPIQLTCHEGKIGDLLTQLTNHRIDVVLADEPASPGGGGKVFNHLLLTSDVTFCAAPRLARSLKGRFPRNLHRAPAILPTHNCNLRRDLEKWFQEVGIGPEVRAESEDAGLAKIFGMEACGFVPVPTVVAEDAINRYGYVSLGRTRAIQTHFYAITAERRLTHPAIIALTTRSALHRQTPAPADRRSRSTLPSGRKVAPPPRGPRPARRPVLANPTRALHKNQARKRSLPA
jgi:LysR family transcriptional activator of nhaA